jgi:hypothetical protein
VWHERVNDTSVNAVKEAAARRGAERSDGDTQREEEACGNTKQAPNNPNNPNTATTTTTTGSRQRTCLLMI